MHEHIPNNWQQEQGQRGRANAYAKEKGIETIVLIDDNEKNVAVGASYGWDCILFTQYVDQSEPGRLLKGSEPSPDMKNIKQAKNTDELVEILRECGVRT